MSKTPTRPQQAYQTALVQMPLMMVREGPKTILKAPADIARECADLKGLAQESFHVITLNVRNGMINRHLITLGLLSGSLAHPREVFRAAILDSAAAVVLIHNHPSGDATPSAEDITLTRQLIAAGQIIGIQVIDHVIIGRVSETDNKGYVSMREGGLCTFGG